MSHSFTFHRELGSGAMGSIFEATNDHSGEKVAVKILHAHLSSDESICSRFDREARASAMLEHPRCIQIESYGILDDGRRFIAMEFIDGNNLEEVLEEHGKLSPSQTIELGIQIADALAVAHDKEVIHRDLKPANILLEKGDVGNPEIRVCDFGIAKILNSSKNSYQTLAGVVCGTPDYISPEQARGLPLDGRSDLYSLGVVLFELLAGRPPFEGKNSLELMNHHIWTAPPNLKNLRNDVPEELISIIEALLEKKAPNRPANATETKVALEAIRSGTPIPEGSVKVDSSSNANVANEFGFDETIEQSRPSDTIITKINQERQSRQDLQKAQKPKRELPLSVLMVGVILVTCAIYAVFAIFVAP